MGGEGGGTHDRCKTTFFVVIILVVFFSPPAGEAVLGSRGLPPVVTDTEAAAPVLPDSRRSGRCEERFGEIRGLLECPDRQTDSQSDWR